MIVQTASVFFQGLMLSLGLIVAIGAQNAFVLRQGLLGQHVVSIVLFCAACDALLIGAGVFGLSQALEMSPLLSQLLAFGGAAFLGFYGWQALQRARRNQSLNAAGDAQQGSSRTLVMMQAAAFTLLNPHVYLDTVLLAGSIGAQQPELMRPWFVLGASMGSLLWFGSLGFGARRLAPVFARPRAWQVLDTLIGLMMLSLAVLMLRQGLQT